MKFTTFIPTHLNDGAPVPESELDAIQMELAIQFGGATDEGIVKGMWFDESGTLYRDTCRKLFVKCDNNRVEEVKETVKSIGRKLGQKAMWIEFDFSDNARIIDCES